MGQACTTADTNEEAYEMAMEFEASRLTLSNIDIIEYERRLKRFAVPENNGKISVE